MFDDRNLVDLLTSSKPSEIASRLSDEQIRSILPSIVWLALQECPRKHRLTVSAELLKIVSRFDEIDTIVELFRVDFSSLNLELKRLRKIREKSLSDGRSMNNGLFHQEILAFDQSSARDRCRLVAEILFGSFENDFSLIKNLLDEANRIESIGDVLFVLIRNSIEILKFEILIENLLESKFAFDYLIRLIFNFPSLQKLFLDSIIRCQKNDSTRFEIVKSFIRLNKNEKFRLLRFCHQRQTLLPLIIEFLDGSTLNIFIEILSDTKKTVWLKKNFRENLTEKIFTNFEKIFNEDQLFINEIFKCVAILHVQCKVRLNEEQKEILLKMLFSRKENLTIGLAFFFVVPSIVERNEEIVINWICSKVSSNEIDEKLLMFGLFCATNQNESLNEVVSSIFDFRFRLEFGSLEFLKKLLVEKIFVAELFVERFSTIKNLKNLDENRSRSSVIVDFVFFLLRSGFFNQHRIEINEWICSEIFQCSSPVDSRILRLINEFVSSVVEPRFNFTLKPIDEEIIRDFLLKVKNRLTNKIVVLLYLLTLIDKSKNKIQNRFENSIRPLFDFFPLPQIVENLTKPEFDAISPQLGRLLMEQLPQIFLADHTLYLETDLIKKQKISSIELLLEQLRAAIEHGISRRDVDQWKRQWFSVYAFEGQLLTLKTAQTLLNNPQLTYEDLCLDPHSLLRTSFQIFNFPPIVQILLFIIRELLIASRHRFERLNLHKFSQTNQSNELVCTQDPKSRLLQENLISAQEALVIQILLDVLHKFKKNACLPAYRELQGVICAFIHQMFINNPDLAKIVHFQGYPSDQIKPMVYSVPSMHICLDFIPQMLASNVLEIQIFAFELLTELCSFYPIRTGFVVVKLAVQVYATLLRILPFEERLNFFGRTYKFLLEMSSVFPPLTSSSVYVVQQALRSCSLSPSNLPQLKWTSNIPGRARQIDK